MKRRSFAVVAMVLLSLSLGARCASSHAQPYSYVDLRLDHGRLRGRVAAHIVDLAHEIGLAEPESLRSASFVRTQRAAIEHVLDARFDLEADGRRIEPHWTTLEVVPERKLVALEWEAPGVLVPGSLRLRGPLFTWEPVHETYLNVYENGALRHQDLLNHSRRESVFFSGGRQGVAAVVCTFVAEGIRHIFLGRDHILFIVGLLLLGGSLGRLLKIITAFTVAHSVTLALAALQLVNPPSRLIEPAIALSIAIVGAENLLADSRKRDGRAVLAFGFGFVHGFGFASVLRELGLPPGALGWSLFSFNLGVEIGQACIVLAVAPLLAAVRSHDPQMARRLVTVGSATVIAAGTYWFVQRVFFT